MTLDPATKELIERLRQERDDARRDAAFARQVATGQSPEQEECARCGAVGPVDVACRGCQAVTFPRSSAGKHDAAAPLPPKPCSARHPDGDRWCYLEEGHEGDHRVPAPREMGPVDFGPRAATSTRRGGA